MTNTLTIPEAIAMTGKNESAIYRYIRKGKLKSYKVTNNDKQVTVIDKDDLKRLFNISDKQFDNQNDKHIDNQVTNNSDIKQIVTEAIQEQQSAIMKPLEQQAMFIAGKLTQENEFLKQQVETLLQEIEKYKLLPGPVEEITEKIHQFEQQLTELQQEKDKTTSALQEEKSIRERTEQEYSQLKDKVNTLPLPIEEIPIKLSNLQEEKEIIIKTTYRLEEEKQKLQEEKQKILEATTRLEEENMKLQEQLKSLPAEPEKINATLLQNAENLLLLKLQNEEIEKKYLEMEASLKSEEEEKQKLKEENKTISTILMQNADNINILQKQREELQKNLQQEQEMKKSEIQKLKDDLAKSEQEKIEIANTWKKELEEARRPWWKFW